MRTIPEASEEDSRKKTQTSPDQDTSTIARDAPEWYFVTVTALKRKTAIEMQMKIVSVLSRVLNLIYLSASVLFSKCPNGQSYDCSEHVIA